MYRLRETKITNAGQISCGCSIFKITKNPYVDLCTALRKEGCPRVCTNLRCLCILPLHRLGGVHTKQSYVPVENAAHPSKQRGLREAELPGSGGSEDDTGAVKGRIKRLPVNNDPSSVEARRWYCRRSFYSFKRLMLYLKGVWGDCRRSEDRGTGESTRW